MSGALRQAAELATARADVATLASALARGDVAGAMPAITDAHATKAVVDSVGGRPEAVTALAHAIGHAKPVGLTPAVVWARPCKEWGLADTTGWNE